MSGLHTIFEPVINMQYLNSTVDLTESGSENDGKFEKSKSQQCKVCSKILSSTSSYYVHMKIHTGNKPFHCNECGASFSRKPYLEVHMRTHTGEKPYQCNICDKCFTQKSSLNTHRRTHTGEKPYSCDICDKRFSVKNYAMAHRWTHTTDKQYRCEECHMSFRSRSQYLIHTKSHASGGTYMCHLCGRAFVKEVFLIRHYSRVHKQPYHNHHKVAHKRSVEDKVLRRKMNTVSNYLPTNRLHSEFVKNEPEEMYNTSSNEYTTLEPHYVKQESRYMNDVNYSETCSPEIGFDDHHTKYEDLKPVEV